MQEVIVIGAGLAGSEAAYQLAKRNIKVILYDMKKIKKTEAHKSDLFCELVCSNSLRSDDIFNAVGLLKNELALLDSLVLRAARKHAIPAGSALAVDRVGFANEVTNILRQHPNIEVIDEEVVKFDLDKPTIVCAGPLCSKDLSDYIRSIIDKDYLYFKIKQLTF